MSKDVRQLRLEIVKLTCYRDVLAADLASECRGRKHASRKDAESRATPASKHHSPSASRAVDVAGASSQSLPQTDASDGPYKPRDSSICESFHSALDFSTDVHNGEGATNSSSSRQDSTGARPSVEITPSSSNLVSQAPSTLSTDALSSRPSLSLSESDHGDATVHANPEQRVSDEQAEEWDKTRAARRVSLVRVPGELKVSSRSIREKHASSIAPSDEEGKRSLDEKQECDSEPT